MNTLTRRGFLASGLTALAGCERAQPVQMAARTKSMLAPFPQSQSLFLFTQSRTGWAPTRWEHMRRGQRILALEYTRGVVRSAELWQLSDHPHGPFIDADKQWRTVPDVRNNGAVSLQMPFVTLPVTQPHQRRWLELIKAARA